ncbi:MAG: isocitrate lyase/phosphoenolpyruvate mutase family protein, partial [Halobacteriales archaeon]|nr:isocitrate lyase/phosphoenolpyruvate mutase family protein [Halobacteriales archaeon]
ELIQRDEILVAPGAYDAVTGKLTARAGAEVVYLSGSSIATSTHGYPDVGLTTLTEMTTRARQVVNAVDIPVFSDADTGYGNPINVKRTVEEFEAAGVAGIHIEDQVFPKRCGHFDGSEVIPVPDMEQKIRSAVDSRSDDAFQIIARTDARSTEGFEAAVDRSNRYVDAGADVIFFEAPRNREEVEAAPDRIDAPVLANMTEGGRTPMFSAAELEAFGYDIVLFPATAFKVMLKSLEEVYSTIVAEGSQEAIMDRVISWEGRNSVTGLDEIERLERRYSSNHQG